MKGNDEKKKGIAEKNDNNPTEKIDEQVGIKKPQTVSMLFKDKMIERLNKESADNINNMNLSQLRTMADEVCDLIEKEKEKTTAEVNREKLKTNYNLIETFILYLFINNKFIDGLGKLAPQKKHIDKLLDEDTQKFNDPIITYLRPHFKTCNTFLTRPGYEPPRKPRIIENVFKNFCIDIDKNNVYTKLYRINKDYVPENKKEHINNNIEEIKKSNKLTLALQEAGVLQKGSKKRHKHTDEMIEAVKSHDENKIKALKDKYNKQKIVIFNPNISKQKNNAENNNNDLINHDIQKCQKNQLNKKRRLSPDIEEQQNKANKKFKHTDNNNTQIQEPIKPVKFIKKIVISHKQQEVNQLFNNINFGTQDRINQQTEHNTIQLSQDSAFQKK